jgi:hypothetical protein
MGEGFVSGGVTHDPYGLVSRECGATSPTLQKGAIL